jgi:ABC-type branched-subunit amino acid transport system substrate-binding protein
VVAAEEEEKEVKIGIMQALTGDRDTYGGPWTDAIQLAVKEANENGGVLSDSKYYTDSRG